MAGSTEKMEKLGSLSEQIDMNNQLNELINYRQGLLKNLQGEVVAEQASLVRIKQEIEQARREAKYQQDTDRQKFLANLEAEKQVLQDERRRLERLDLEVEGRRKEVAILESKAAPIKESMKKLSDERLSIEQQRIRNEELRQQNDRLANATSSMHAEVSQLKSKLLEDQRKLGIQFESIHERETALESAKKDTALQLENLSALKETIDPKLAEVRKLQEDAEAQLNQSKLIQESITKQQSDIDKQKADLAILSSRLQAKSDALTEYDSRLRATEAELRIKAQEAKVKVDVPEAPEKEGKKKG